VRCTLTVRGLLGLAMLVVALPRSLAAGPVRAPIATTPHFAFYSDFEVNLNDVLINAGVARRFRHPELFHDGADVACFGKLPPALRAAWNRALDYYAEIISPAGSNDRRQYLIRVRLAGFTDEREDAAERQFVDIAQAFRAAAAPAYRECRWAAQDEKNRRWIAALRLRLAAHEEAIAARLPQLYRKPWADLPIPVDVVETVDWSGANTILRDPNGGHVLIAIENENTAALEVVFHESSHLFMRRNDPLPQALETAASAAHWQLPGDLSHAVLFYTTGEAVRRVLEEAGERGYRPMVYGIYDRGTWVGYREPIKVAWGPYVDGKRTLAAAAADLVDTLRKQAPPRAHDAQPKATPAHHLHPPAT
jgi:hypothetical protein